MGSGRIGGFILAAAVAALTLPRAPWANAAAQPAPAAPAESPEQSIQRDLQQQAAALNDPASKPEQRQQAAERLVSRNREDARQVLLAALQDSSSRFAQQGQIVVARALAADARPDPRFVDPLHQLLSKDPIATEAAVAGLTPFGGESAGALNALIDFAGDRGWPPRSRAIAIRGLGSFVNKRAAAFLIGLINNPNEDPQVRAAALDALGDMTGLGQQFKRDVAAWNNWWNAPANQDQPPVNWEAAQYRNRAAGEANTRRELQRLTDKVRELLIAQYHTAPDNQRADLLLRWMRDTDAAVRVVGPELVQEDALSAKRIPATVIGQLRVMIGDSAVAVRKAVVGTLSVINDADSAPPLFAQLAVEADPDVRAAIVQCLAHLRDPRAVAAILPLLNDPAVRVAEAAATALRELGPQVAADPATEAAVATALRNKLVATRNQLGTEDLRSALLDAMGALNDPALLRFFLQAINANDPQNTVKIRVAAAKGLGGMREPAERQQAAQELSIALRRDVPPVRLEAAHSLGVVGDFGVAEALYAATLPANEADASVRDEAWRSLSTLFSRPEATADDLIRGWVDRFRKDPRKRLSVLEATRNKLIAANPTDKVLHDLATVQQNIGDAYLSLEQWGPAAAAYRAALSYWDGQRAARDVVSNLSSQLLVALLRSANYADAVQFAGARIARNDQERGDLSRLIRDEVERLVTNKDPRAALQLIDEVGKLQPPLTGLFADQLQQKRREIEQKPPANP